MSDAPIAPVALSTADRLAAAKAERARLKAQFDAVTAEGELEVALAKEELDLANEKALFAASVKLGPIGVKWDALLTRLGVVIVKRSTDTHFKQYQEDPEFSFERTEAFVKRCVEYPAPAAFDAIYTELPGIITDLSNMISKLMGARAGERVKK